MESNTKVAVITGASQGLGLVLTGEFAKNNWTVIGTGISEKSDGFPGETYKQFDASDIAACTNFWQELHADYPDTQICLVNNAGGFIGGSLLDTKPEDYMRMIQSCYFAALYMTRGLVTTNDTARIINVISAGALRPAKNNSAYAAAKGAEMHFFQSLQEEFSPRQYRITNLYPNMIATHDDNPASIKPIDLASFIREQAENNRSYYLRDVAIFGLG